MKIADGRTRYISEEFLAAVVVLVALAVRILHVIFTARLNPLAGDLVLDAAIYDRWAKALVWGGELPATQLMQAPLYPWFVSMVYRVFGPSLTAVRAAQAALGVFACGFVITATRRLLGSSTAGIIAGLIMALYLPAIFYEGILLPASLILFLSAWFLVLMTHDRGNAGPLRLTAAGFVLGLSVLARPTALLMIPFALAHLVVAPRIAPDPPAPPLVRRIGALLAGLVLAIAPMAVRNTRMTGGVVPVTTGGGINFYI
ncbi:MAG: glycosyltransferase family 39 protein, partial [Candidatus Krumholzibacteria bacterium]|nr:glycosyltransferase family 39 protein [Candidatus Krumholzibacteria bacterium]